MNQPQQEQRQVSLAEEVSSIVETIYKYKSTIQELEGNLSRSNAIVNALASKVDKSVLVELGLIPAQPKSPTVATPSEKTLSEIRSKKKKATKEVVKKVAKKPASKKTK